MKDKRTLLAVAVLVIATIVSVSLTRNHQYAELSDIQLENIEALADAEGGTPVDDCYLLSTNGKFGWYIKCNENTSSGMIFPCDSQAYFFMSSGSTKCTK